MSRADDRRGLNAIERRLADDDPALAQAFQRWQVPEGPPDARDGETTAPPWVLGVFLTAAVSWVVSPGFGVLVAVVALSCILVGTDRTGRNGRRRATGVQDAGGPDGVDPRDDGGLPPYTWRGGWI